MKNRLIAMLGLLAVAIGIAPALPADAAGSVYTTPGLQTVNGRQWKTTCEGYSGSITRCWAWIHGTTIQQQGSRYVSVTGWQFNNLTYIGGTRENWRGNPMASTGTWSQLGRNYKTSCGDSWTGPNGCRTFIQGTLIVPNGKGGYTKKTDWVFNNVVAFSPSGKSATPAPVAKPVVRPDFSKKTCSTGLPGTHYGIDYNATKVTVRCSAPASFVGVSGQAGPHEVVMTIGRSANADLWSQTLTHEMAHVIDYRASWDTRKRLYKWVGITNVPGPGWSWTIDYYRKDGSLDEAKWAKAPFEIFAESVTKCASPNAPMPNPTMAKVPKAKCGAFLADFKAAVVEVGKQP